MTSPMVDTVRTIPLVIEREVVCEPMDGDHPVDKGFPFDREDRDDHFRSQLDDLANRHPELAEHLEGFPFRSHTLGRNRPPRPSEQEFRRFADRPFGSSRFERFGFPFSNDPFEEDFKSTTQPQPQQQPSPQQEQTSNHPPQPSSQQEPKEEETEDRPKERGRKQNIQPSNTVDLGQKQEPVNDRNQRSMSAPPPDNRQRYVSSIHIPINREGGMGDMGKAQSQQQPQPQQQQEKPANKPNERVIPIHVEGRDEPVVPKHTGPSFSQQPQPERIFGHSPSHFTQYVGREPPRQYSAGPEWHHNFGPEVRQQKFQQQAAPPQQHSASPPQQPQKFQEQQTKQVPVQKQQEQVPPQPQPPKAGTPIDIIQSIQKDVSALMAQVEKFAGQPRDKQYLYLDEMLTRNLIKLDNVDTQGQENIRQARKEAIKCIEGCIGILEAKAAANVPREKQPEQVDEAKMEEVKTEEAKTEEEKAEEPKAEEPQKMEVEGENKPKETVEEKMEAAPIPLEDKMEVVVPEVAPSAEEAPKEAANEPQPQETPKEGKPEEQTEAKAEDGSQDESKEKKKGKKKVVKKKDEEVKQ